MGQISKAFLFSHELNIIVYCEIPVTFLTKKPYFV